MTAAATGRMTAKTSKEQGRSTGYADWIDAALVAPDAHHVEFRSGPLTVIAKAIEGP